MGRVAAKCGSQLAVQGMRQEHSLVDPLPPHRPILLTMLPNQLPCALSLLLCAVVVMEAGQVLEQQKQPQQEGEPVQQ